MKKLTRKQLLALLAALIVVVITINRYRADSPPAGIAETEYRMPTGKPLLEPDRPDLNGDPGIDNEYDKEGEVPDE